jgi:hypothetical protein
MTARAVGAHPDIPKARRNNITADPIRDLINFID